MSDIVKLIEPHYFNYCDKYKLMDFEQFNQFFRDFDIFPNVLNLLQLKNIYFSVHDIIKDKTKNSKDQIITPVQRREVLKNFKINIYHFLDAICLCSMHIKGMDESNDYDRIISIVDKMANSNGIEKSQKRSGKTL